MQAPASVSVSVQPARAYQFACSVAALLAIIFIANYAVNSAANGQFGLKILFLSVLTGLCAAWLLASAFRAPCGQLRFTQGAWLWTHAKTALHKETEGTLHVALDLQSYVLVQFVPQHLPQRAQFFVPNTPWLHLQAQYSDPASWLALRRALTYSQGSSHEELAG